MVNFSNLVEDLNRFAVGFEPTFNAFEMNMNYASSYPPYNIEKIGQDKYQIALAVAGFKASDINIVHQDSKLMVDGKINDPSEREYIYKGIATREFYKEFQLENHVKIVGSNLSNGILTIDLHKEVPESMKPRKIEISTSPPSTMIENKK